MSLSQGGGPAGRFATALRRRQHGLGAPGGVGAARPLTAPSSSPPAAPCPAAAACRPCRPSSAPRPCARRRRRACLQQEQRHKAVGGASASVPRRGMTRTARHRSHGRHTSGPQEHKAGKEGRASAYAAGRAGRQRNDQGQGAARSPPLFLATLRATPSSNRLGR